VTPAAFTTRVEHAPLHVPATGTTPNGVYAYGSASSFPLNSKNGASNYWVDPLFQPAASTPAAPGLPTSVSATPGEEAATVSWAAPWDGGSTITSYTITPYAGSMPLTPTTVAGPATSATVSGLVDGVSYTFTVAATNSVGTGPASSPSNAVTPSAQPQGQWSALQNWPLVAIHSALLKTGRVLTWDGWQQPQPSQEFDLSTQTFLNQQNSPDAIFCGGMAELPDGRVIVIGGNGVATGKLGLADTNIYDPTTSTWTRVADMHYPRWYPALTELPDGRYLAVSGKSVNLETWADKPEVYDPKANTWTELSGVSTSQIRDIEYPNDYVLPNGNVFVLGPAEDKSFELNVNNHTWTQVGGSSGVVNGASIMYRPGKVLYAGGAASLTSETPANANAATIDLTASNPAWQPTAPMNYARAFNIMTMLADGNVLMIGGQPLTGGTRGSRQVSGGVLPAEVWNPTTGAWTTVASMAATRGYHTSALLLPDGRVLVAGSGHANSGFAAQYSSQIYSPPYLFNGPRPTISSAPTAAAYGSSITVSTPDAASISQVNLVDLGASTHQTDGDQRFVPLSFTQGSGSLTVQAPPSGNLTPPGNYMLFIVNSKGVPSVASIINISASGTSAAAARARSATVTRAASGPGGAGSSPALVQRVTAYSDTVRRLPIRPQHPVTAGDRLVVEASSWGGAVARVTDSSRNRYTELVRRTAADGTEMSVWTAPVTAGRGTRPTITVTGGSLADIGAVALEYSGLSTAPGAAAIDQVASRTGTTRGPVSVSSGAAGTTARSNELAIGVYADSGFGDVVRAAPGWTERANVSPSVTMMEQLVEDQVVAAGSRPRAAAVTGSETPWLMATIVFRGRTGGQTAPRARSWVALSRAGSASRSAPIPLSKRRRPHLIAGAVTNILERTASGRVLHFFCLVDTAGKPSLSPLLAESAEQWLKLAVFTR
jgi:hypothetical protein